MIRHNQSVLVVTETHSVFYTIRRILTTNGWRTVHLQTIDDASKTVEENPVSLVIIDDKLRQSTSFYHHLRHTLQLPVLVLSENTSAANGSTSIIDSSDYLYQPFEAAECINAIQAAQQRHSSTLSNKPPLIHLGRVTIDFDNLEATQDDEVIHLTRTEWALLEQLALHANKTMTHQILLQRVWGDAYVDEHSYLHTYMRRLRRKLEPDPANPCYLITDVGIGYRLMVSQNGFGDPHDSSEPARPENTSVRSHQLTAPPTSFLGRKHDLNELQKLLENPDVQLLTLTGLPGVGKTRLALHLVERIRDRFADGSHVISLAPLQDSSLVVSAIAQALEIKEVAQQTIEETLKQALHKRAMLLLLDNFEHVLEAAPVLVELITTAPRLTILVTSRTSLRVTGEQEYLVAPLEMPDTTTIITKEIAEANPAVKLFVQRSQSVKADFALTEENAAAIVAICARLDGLPLAIELAAARSKLFTPQALLTRLDERLDILTRGLRGAPERHQTLRAALEWSYNLLTPEEQQMLMGLSVFVGGCTLEAATAVLDSEQVLVTPLALPEQTVPAEPEPIDVSPSTSFLDKIAALVDHSLIQVQTDSNGESRFVLLETIREYASEKLYESGNFEHIHSRYVEYYLLMAEQAKAEIHGPQQIVWFRQVETEHDNFRTILIWSLQQNNSNIALRLASALWFFWYTQNHLQEGQRFIKTALQKFTSLTSMKIKSELLNALGVIASWQCDYVEATFHYEQCLSLQKQLCDKQGIARTIGNLGTVCGLQGNYDQAKIYYTESLHLCRENRDDLAVAKALHNLSDVALSKNQYEEALALETESLAIFQDMGDTRSIIVSLLNLVKINIELKRNSSATTFCIKGITLAKELCDGATTIFVLESITDYAFNQKHWIETVYLLSIVEKLRDLFSLPRAIADREWFEQVHSNASENLDSKEWRSYYEKGKSFNMDEAMNFALEYVRGWPQI